MVQHTTTRGTQKITIFYEPTHQDYREDQKYQEPSQPKQKITTYYQEGQNEGSNISRKDE
jgi:hypothetical protein